MQWSHRSCESNHETISATGANLFLESKAEDSEQVATQKIYCCLFDSNSQHTLNFGEWPDRTTYPLIYSMDYSAVATQTTSPIIKC